MLIGPRGDDKGSMIAGFVEALRNPDAADPDRLDWAYLWVATALGGRVSLLLPFKDSGREYPAESILGQAEREGRLVSRSDWLHLLQEQLHEMVGKGLGEAFSVRSLVHYVTDFAESHADPNESQAKAETVRRILSELETDSAALEEFKRDTQEAAGVPDHLTDRELV
jgi:hypothetical protein